MLSSASGPRNLFNYFVCRRHITYGGILEIKLTGASTYTNTYCRQIMKMLYSISNLTEAHFQHLQWENHILEHLIVIITFPNLSP